jgi:MinD-like ATPase involved in chromosome partitioning or flagellar assembly
MSNTEVTPKDRKRFESLALLSGKGGSGKTVIALSMARVLAEGGVKVLLIDCDVSTHGASYFLESEFSESSGYVTSLAGTLGGDNRFIPLQAKSGFAFIPSTTDPSVKAEFTSPFPDIMAKFWNFITANFEAVILDCQAGYSPVTEWAVGVATRKLIVLEPDAISAAALRVLSIQLGYKLRSSNTWQVFNKLTAEERPLYEKVMGGTLFSNLPPLPFDWQVRAAFGLREIPGVLTAGSAFGLGVLRLMQTLFPAFADQLAELERRSVGDWYAELTKSLETLRDQQSYHQIRTSELRRKRRLVPAQLLAALVGTLGVVTALLPFVNSRLPNYSNVVITTIGAGLAAISIVLFQQFQRNLSVEREEELSQQQLLKTQQDVERFETLLATDPRLKEYVKGRNTYNFDDLLKKD